MKTISVLAASAVLAAGALTTTGAEARWRGGGGAVAAGVLGGLAAGAAIGAATSGYGYGRPAYGYDDGYSGGYAGGYRAAGYDYGDAYDVPRYRTRRVIRETYEYGPSYGSSYRGYDDDLDD